MRENILPLYEMERVSQSTIDSLKQMHRDAAGLSDPFCDLEPGDIVIVINPNRDTYGDLLCVREVEMDTLVRLESMISESKWNYSREDVAHFEEPYAAVAEGRVAWA